MKHLLSAIGWVGVVLVVVAVIVRFSRPDLPQWSQGLALAGLIVTLLYALTQWRDIARAFSGRDVRYGSVSVVSVLLLLAIPSCEPAEDVRVQELPPLERSSVESRLGLPALEGAWPFAGWELAQGDTLGMEAELPIFGAIQVVEQKRDSLGGVYTDAAGAAAPLSGEVRRDGVIALVAFPGGGAGRYLVGSVAGDTIWVESSTLATAGEWRDDARAAFVRGAAAGSPFRRRRGVMVAAPVQPAGDTLAAISDSLPPMGADSSAASAAVTAPAMTGGAAAGAGTADQPVTQSGPEPEQEEAEPEPQPRPAPTIERRQAPRVLGDPVERDDGSP